MQQEKSLWSTLLDIHGLLRAIFTYDFFTFFLLTYCASCVILLSIAFVLFFEALSVQGGILLKHKFDIYKLFELLANVFIIVGVCFMGYTLLSNRINHNTSISGNTHNAFVGQYIETLSVTNLNEEPVDIKLNNSPKPKLLWFIWSKCAACENLVPLMNNIYSNYHSVVDIYGFTLSDTQQEIREFINTNDIFIPFFIDQHRHALDVLNIEMLPTLFVINHNNRVVDVIIGYCNDTESKTMASIKGVIGN